MDDSTNAAMPAVVSRADWQAELDALFSSMLTPVTTTPDSTSESAVGRPTSPEPTTTA
jgi:hypothetical protein